ncbi:hypothetical protein ACWEFJ_17055 [Actinosynnema sp. NPDC004786]
MPGDVLGIDVQLGEDDLDDGPLHGIAASTVEALWVGQEREGGGEELPILI